MIYIKANPGYGARLELRDLVIDTGSPKPAGSPSIVGTYEVFDGVPGSPKNWLTIKKGSPSSEWYAAAVSNTTDLNDFLEAVGSPIEILS